MYTRRSVLGMSINDKDQAPEVTFLNISEITVFRIQRKMCHSGKCQGGRMIEYGELPYQFGRLLVGYW